MGMPSKSVHRESVRTRRRCLVWHGHRAFAVDGSKLNLPRPLLHDGYRTPSHTAHYPQGLLSCLFQLRARLPVDFDLAAHGDVVVYDRRCYSFRLLHAHAERGLHAVFRLQSNANACFRDFVRSAGSEALVTVEPSADTWRQQPDAAFRPCRVRLVKYSVGATTYTLATTLLDRKRYPVRALADLYHARWGGEELYKVSKQMLANFRNGLINVGRNLEALFLQYTATLSETVGRILDSIGGRRH